MKSYLSVRRGRLPRRRRPNYIGRRVATIHSHSTRFRNLPVPVSVSLPATVSAAGDVWGVNFATATAATGSQILNLFLIRKPVVQRIIKRRRDDKNSTGGN
uniref:Uncharacterized protein n=1 Tax=Cucumis melo TaxID=3656 RepID=A0A9I9E8P4_CUCME